jgi:hypothetical protein
MVEGGVCDGHRSRQKNAIAAAAVGMHNGRSRSSWRTQSPTLTVWGKGALVYKQYGF